MPNKAEPMSDNEIQRLSQAREYWEVRRRAKILTLALLAFSLLGGGTLYFLRSQQITERMPGSTTGAIGAPDPAGAPPLEQREPIRYR
jgi:hypothetical protein